MRVATIICLAIILAACGEQEIPALKKPEVFVILASAQPYQPSRTYNARIQSTSDVDIIAQVSGELLKIQFTEGERVNKSDLLFEVDSKAYDAELARAESELNATITELDIAEKNYRRGKELVDAGSISESDFDKLTAKRRRAESEVESFQARVDSAQINVDYTRIRAPIEGRIGRSVPSIGDLVGPDFGALTTLIGNDDMQAVFQLPERLVLRLKKPGTDISVEDIIASIIMEDDTEYGHSARISYLSNRVDPATGTIEARINIPNPDNLLRPGMFVRTILRLEKPVQSLVVPQAAVQVDQLGSYVFIVDDSDKVVRKNIETDDRIGENVVIIDGLDAGDRVIVRGIQRVRPGDAVMVSDFIPATSASGE